MPTSGHFVVEVPTTDRGRGSSDTPSLQASYPASPIYSGEINDNTVQEQFEELVIDGEVVNGFMFEDGYNRDYVEAPNLSEVESDNLQNAVSSPFAPSLASPPGGVDDWANQPATPEQTQQAGQQSGGPFPGNTLTSPSRTTADISRQTIGSLKKGTSIPGSSMPGS